MMHHPHWIFSVLFCAVFSLTASAQDLESQWLEIESIAKDEARGYSGIQFSYHSAWVSGSANHPDFVIENEVEYSEQGAHYRIFLDSRRERFRAVGPLEPTGQMVLKIEQSYDGKWLRMRSSDSQGVLFQSAQRTTWSLPSPLPWDYIQPVTRTGMQEAFENERLVVVSIDEVQGADGKSLIEVLVNYAAKDSRALRLYYDPERGHNLIRAQSFYESGEHYRTLRDVKIQTIEQNQATYHIPVKGVIETFNTEGERTGLRTIEVDINSIVVEEEPVERNFAIEPQPNERMFNSDKSVIIPR